MATAQRAFASVRLRRGRTRPRPRAATLLMLAPVIVVAVALGAYPILSGIWIGFTNERVGGVFGLAKTRPIGFANFTSIFGDPAFVSGLVLILKIAVAVVVTTYTLAYLLAALLNTDFPFRRVVRTIVLLPMAVPAVVVGEVFRYLYDPNVGPVNGLFVKLGLVQHPQFLATSSLQWIWIAIPSIWITLPFAALFLLAAIQGVPPELLEAARLDGAGWFGRFRHVTFPATRGALAAIIPLSFAAQLLAFEMYVALLGGALGSVASAGLLIPSVYAYSNLADGLMGRAAATADIILLAILAAFLLSRYISMREERRR
jgi:multiple sugar transport system permease protein